MSTERTRKLHSPATEELHSPTAESVPPLHSSLPCPMVPEEDSYRGMPGQTSAQSASCWKPLLLMKGRGQSFPPGQLQCCSLQPSCRRRYYVLLIPCSNIWRRPPAHILPARWSRQRAAWFLWQAFGHPMSSVHADNLSCTSWAVGVKWERLTLHVQDRTECATNIGAESDLQSFSFNSSQSPRLQHPLTAFSIAYNGQALWQQAAASRPISSGITHQVHPQATSLLSARWTSFHQEDKANLHEPTDTDKVPQLPVFVSMETCFILPGVLVITVS